MTYRILHVDDDALMRDLVALSLTLDPAFLLLSCESGAEALRVAAEWAPDLILCDVMMPDMDGQTLLERLRADPATAAFPVLFMSAYATPAEAEAAAARGAVGVIIKPFDPETLAETLHRRLRAIKLGAAAYDFRQRLQRDAATLAAFRGRLTDAGTPAEMQSLVHKLAGAAGIFKYGAVTARASALEAAIIEARAGRAAPQSLADKLDALIASMAQAHQHDGGAERRRT